jgi:hypothetical protein
MWTRKPWRESSVSAPWPWRTWESEPPMIRKNSPTWELPQLIFSSHCPQERTGILVPPKTPTPHC